MSDTSHSNSSKGPSHPPKKEEKPEAKASEKKPEAKTSEQKQAETTDKTASKASTPSNEGQKSPDELAQAVEAAKAAKRLQDTVNTLKEQAKAIKDPAERERLFRAAYEKEVEAHGQSKKARALASGWGQGAGAGAGISGAVGMGLGNLVGVLLSGVVAVPGVLAGAGVGAMHGPWFSLPGTGGKKGGKHEEGKSDDEKGGEEFSDDEMHDAIVKAAGEADGTEGSK